MICNVIAVHNTVGDVKPLWILRDGEKSKVEKVNSVMNLPGLTVYHCIVDGCMVSIRFDGVNWFTN
jgi:hypothetical protein